MQSQRHDLPAQGETLADLVKRWRSDENGDPRFVPNFDPEAAGTQARILVLMERPAPSTVNQGAAAVCGEGNGSPAVQAFVAARRDARLSRATYLRWNIIPWVSPTTPAPKGATGPGRAAATELDAARPALHELLLSLPSLRAVVTLGAPALTGVMRYFTLHPAPLLYPVLAAPHPSPANGVHRHEQHTRMVNALRRAALL